MIKKCIALFYMCYVFDLTIKESYLLFCTYENDWINDYYRNIYLASVVLVTQTLRRGINNFWYKHD
jgi:hypothetical protein